MKLTSELVYLASYPKSGNTWLRIFLGHLMKGEKLNINKMNDYSQITSSRTLFEKTSDLNSYELTDNEIAYYKPLVIEQYIKEQSQTIFFKSHEAYLKTKFNNWLLPQKPSYKTVYIVRNPLDVCVSYTHHGGISDYDKTIKYMCDGAKPTTGTHNQLAHYIGSWSEHIDTWTSNFPAKQLLIVRYEDMVNNPLATFTQITHFIGISCSKDQIDRAIALSSFDRLQKLEEKISFSEKPIKAKKFFRRGKIASWKEELTTEQVKEIEKSHFT
ncbi:sulfotransferase domain-containing protein, partial [Echinicola sediminis]